MKLMFVVIRDKDVDVVVQTLVENKYRVTRVASTGGFLRSGNGTLMIGVEEDKVQGLIDLLRQVLLPAGRFPASCHSLCSGYALFRTDLKYAASCLGLFTVPGRRTPFVKFTWGGEWAISLSGQIKHNLYWFFFDGFICFCQ